MPFGSPEDLGTYVAQVMLAVLVIFFCLSAPLGFVIALIIRRLLPMYERSRLEIIMVGFAFALISVLIFSILIRFMPIADMANLWEALAVSFVLTAPIVTVGYVVIRLEIGKSAARVQAALDEKPEEYSYWDDRSRGKTSKDMKSFNRPRRK